MPSVKKITGSVLLAGYPIAVWAAISMAGTRVAGLIVLVALAVMLLLRIQNLHAARARAMWGWGAGLVLLMLLSVLLNDQRLLLMMPVLINAALLVGFGASLLEGRMPIVERFARMTHGDLSPARVAHCRAVTKVWCLFFLLNGLASLWLALFAPIAFWTLYTGGIAYLFMGALFAGEYAIRKIRFG